MSVIIDRSPFLKQESMESAGKGRSRINFTLRTVPQEAFLWEKTPLLKPIEICMHSEIAPRVRLLLSLIALLWNGRTYSRITVLSQFRRRVKPAEILPVSFHSLSPCQRLSQVPYRHTLDYAHRVKIHTSTIRGYHERMDV